MRCLPFFAVGVVLSLLPTMRALAADPGAPSDLLPAVEKYVQKRVQEFAQIPEQRKEQLGKLAQYVQRRIQAGESARLVFICTHNSRRSHLSQIWAAVAAHHYGIDRVDTYSGGTEATAFNPRAVAAIERAGMEVTPGEEAQNTRYAVRYCARHEPLVCFSKVYGDPPNPNEAFCAVMTCAQADQNCPLVKGCALRIAIPYEDPKAADGTPEEAARYDERCAQIGREMLYLFSQVGK